MRTYPTIHIQNATPTVTIEVTLDDQQVIDALYHRLNIGSRRLVNAKKIRNGRASGQKYGNEYDITKEAVKANDTPLQDIADAIEPYVS